MSFINYLRSGLSRTWKSIKYEAEVAKQRVIRFANKTKEYLESSKLVQKVLQVPGIGTAARWVARPLRYLFHRNVLWAMVAFTGAYLIGYGIADFLNGDYEPQTNPLERLPDEGDKNTGDNKPGDDKPGDDKPGDDKPGDDKPGDDKPGDDKPGDNKPGDGDDFELDFKWIHVESGHYMMGTDRYDAFGESKPLHEVEIDEFWISDIEITRNMWFRVMNHHTKDVALNGPMSKLMEETGDVPITDISYYEAVEFCNKLSEITGLECRLPTDAEWEYAARGGHKSMGYLYSGSDEIDDVAWYNRSLASEEGNKLALPKPHKVRSKEPNELDIYDMSGNVSEYCLDYYDKDYYKHSPVKNPKGPDIANADLLHKRRYGRLVCNEDYPRVMRGGSYASTDYYCTTFARKPMEHPNSGSPDVGFRVVRSKSKSPVGGKTPPPGDDDDDDDDEIEPPGNPPSPETYLVLDQSELDVDNNAGSFEVGYTIINPKGCAVSATKDPGDRWLRCDVTQGYERGTINIHVTRFMQDETRSSTITVLYEDGLHELVVSQKGKDSRVDGNPPPQPKEGRKRITEKVNGVEFHIIPVEGDMSNTYGFGNISDFYIAETEVTQELWNAVMGDLDRRTLSRGKGDDYPMYGITYHEAEEFCRRLNAIPRACCGFVVYSLPSGGEWKYAANGGKYSSDYRYSGGDDIDQVAWYTDNSYVDSLGCKAAHPVKGKRPNKLGLYDMSGNVQEWTTDSLYYAFVDTYMMCYYGGSFATDKKGCEISTHSDWDYKDERNASYGLRLRAKVTR